MPGYLFLPLNLLFVWGKGVGDDQNQEPNAWDGHSDAKMDGVDDDVDDNFDDDADDNQIKLITNEENEEAWHNFPDVSPGRFCIPWKLLHL